MLTLRHIEVFHAVYQAGSLTAAARALNISQPSVSKVLHHAESRIGIQLFRLVRGRLVPTEEAHTLFREARELQARIASFQQTTKNLRSGGADHIRLAVLPSLGLDVAPAAVAQFRASRPHVSFAIQTLHNEDILRSLYERNSDLAVSFDAPRHPRLTALSLGTGQLVALFRRDDLPDPPPQIPWSMLAERPLVRLSGDGSVTNLFTSQIQEGQAAATGVSVQTYYVAAALVRHGGGFAIVDEFTARAAPPAELDFRPIEGGGSFTIYCSHLEDRPLTKAAADFIAILQRLLRPNGHSHRL